MIKPHHRFSSIWTEKATAKLIDLWKTNLSCREIAYKLGSGFTKNSVIGKARRLKLASKK